MSSNPSNKNRKGRRMKKFTDICFRLSKNKLAMVGLVILLILLFFSIFADKFASQGIDEQDLTLRFLRPCKEYPFGTDAFGRDILSRVMYGGRVSLKIGLFAQIFAVTVGCLFGSLAGYYGGWVDNLIMRFMDIMLAIPGMLMAISIVAALGGSVTNVIIAIGISQTPRMARVVRASILTVKDSEYIEAARAVGTKNAKIILTHILPNCIAPIIVQTTLGVGKAITQAASLSFIGLGVQPPNPEWGAMLCAARQHMLSVPYTVVFPGLAIMAAVFSLNVLGDGLRDALDPRLKT